MSTVVASYALVGRCPLLRASSGIPAASRSWRPAAASPASVAVRRRRPLSVARALPEKERPAFNIPHDALLHPIKSPDAAKDRWSIEEEEDHVKLSFKVPGFSMEDFEIRAAEDMLEIKRKEGKTTLLMTKEYDSRTVTADLRDEVLEVSVRRSKNRDSKPVRIGPPSKNDPAPETSGQTQDAAAAAGRGDRAA